MSNITTATPVPANESIATIEEVSTAANRAYLDTDEAKGTLNYVECVLDDLAGAIALIDLDGKADPVELLLNIEEYAQGVAADIRAMIEGCLDASCVRDKLADAARALVVKDCAEGRAQFKACVDVAWASEKKLPKELRENLARLGIPSMWRGRPVNTYGRLSAVSEIR